MILSTARNFMFSFGWARFSGYGFFGMENQRV